MPAQKHTGVRAGNEDVHDNVRTGSRTSRAGHIDVEAYLKRIKYEGSLTATPETLRDLQLAHLYTIPFENLSIHIGEAIVLDEETLFDKIVRRQRGGFCYELNGLFGSLLGELGFDVVMLSAGVMDSEGSFGPEFDHMALMVRAGERWLVDVGFGDSFREPLLLDARGEQRQGRRSYRIDHDGDYQILMQKKGDGDWEPQYRFTLVPHQHADYTAMCRYHQTSPQSPFTRKRVCTRATPAGRLTLSEMRFITTTEEGKRIERELADEEQFKTLLHEQFGINLR